MSLPKLYWDIETAPLPLAELEAMMPEFEAAKNLKDPAKIAADIEDKKQSFIADAALRATTGRIIAFAYCYDDKEPAVVTGNEDLIIADMMDVFGNIVSQNGSAYSFNGHGFDIPFICQRSAINNRPALRNLLAKRIKGRTYPHETQIDVMKEWTCGQDFRGHGLDAVAKALGLPGKTGSGKDFAKLLETDKDAAIKYAAQDVNLVRQIANKMGI